MAMSLAEWRWGNAPAMAHEDGARLARMGTDRWPLHSVWCCFLRKTFIAGICLDHSVLCEADIRRSLPLMHAITEGSILSTCQRKVLANSWRSMAAKGQRSLSSIILSGLCFINSALLSIDTARVMQSNPLDFDTISPLPCLFVARRINIPLVTNHWTVQYLLLGLCPLWFGLVKIILNSMLWWNEFCVNVL